jgi:ParB family chromosome partitioning protein
MIDRNGEPMISRGLVKRSDVKTVRKLQATEPTAVAQSADEEQTAVEDEALSSGPRLPRTLVEDLTKARTRALRDQVAMHPHIALALVVHVLAQQSLRTIAVPGVRISTLAAGFDDTDTVERARSALIAELNETEARLDTFVDLPAARLMDMLAIFVAETLSFTHQGATNEDDRVEAVADTLDASVDLDMSHYWEVSREFLERAPKAFVLDAVSTTPALQRLSDEDRTARLTALGKLKKSDLAQTALPLLRDALWLPEHLETPVWRGRLALTEDAARLIEATNAA